MIRNLTIQDDIDRIAGVICESCNFQVPITNEKNIVKEELKSLMKMDNNEFSLKNFYIVEDEETGGGVAILQMYCPDDIDPVLAVNDYMAAIPQQRTKQMYIKWKKHNNPLGEYANFRVLYLNHLCLNNYSRIETKCTELIKDINSMAVSKGYDLIYTDVNKSNTQLIAKFAELGFKNVRLVYNGLVPVAFLRMANNFNPDLTLPE